MPDTVPPPATLAARAGMTPQDARALMRSGQWRTTTNGFCLGYYQANIAIVSSAIAEEFGRFCNLNPAACPVIDIIPQGQLAPAKAAPDSDIRTDIAAYEIHGVDGSFRDVSDLTADWTDDYVTFLLGCSFSFDGVVRKAGIDLPHFHDDRFIAAYATNIACVPYGRFSGFVACSVRPVPKALVDRIAELSAQYPLAHGAPQHIGDPAAISVDLNGPDLAGRTLPPLPDDWVPMFWACGITPTSVLQQAETGTFIVHKPGHMLITDIPI